MLLTSTDLILNTKFITIFHHLSITDFETDQHCEAHLDVPWPPKALQDLDLPANNTMWWDDDTIETSVTREFVCSHLLPDEISRLDLPLGFGDGLTDGTYWEWIDEKAKRIFLTLVDLGVPDQIFGVIDDSWDDQDLPVALDQVERLALTAEKDAKLEKKFYYRQFYYLLRPLQKGEHVIYQDLEVPPLDVVEKKQTLATGQSSPVDKVTLPDQPGMVFCRRRVPLACAFGPGYMSQEDFLYEVNGIRNLQNDHLVSYWASYVHEGYGYILFTPATEFSLKTFLTNTPASIKNLDKLAQRQLVMNWIHCLLDTLSFLHNRGLSHGNIRPSTVLFSAENQIYLSDFSIFNPEALLGSTGNSFDKEAYDYAAPEQWYRPTTTAAGPPNPLLHRRATALATPSTSPDTTLTRSLTDPTPHLNPQAADIFSVGCIILDLLSFLLKKHGRPFAAHRAARHKTPGRGGAVPDASFHKNLAQVEAWMTQLSREATKKAKDKGAEKAVFRGVSPALHVVERMMAPHPGDRPGAGEVQTRLYRVLTEACGIAEPHCVHQYGGWDFGVGRLKLREEGEKGDVMSIRTKRSSGGSGSGSGGSVKRLSGGSVRRGGGGGQQLQYQQQYQQYLDERDSELLREQQWGVRGSSLGQDGQGGIAQLRGLRGASGRERRSQWQQPVY